MKKLALISALLIPLDASGQSITSVTGPIARSAHITIAGSSFGTGATVFLFDNFEGGADGDVVSLSGPIIGSWHSYGDTGACTQQQNPTYSTNFANSGSQSMQIHEQACFRPGIMADIDDSELFYYYHVYIPNNSCIECSVSRCASSCGGQNWKINWLLGPGKSTSSGDRYVLFTEGDQRNGTGSNSSDQTYNIGSFIGDVAVATGLTQSDRTMWWEHYISVGADGFGDVSTHGKKGDVSDVRQALLSQTNVELQDDTGDWDSVSNKYHFLDIASFGSQKDVWIDDVYIAQGANSRARVAITNASTLATSTQMTLCTTGGTGDSWAATQIVCTVRGGVFVGDVWVYVFDGSGGISSGDGPYTWAIPHLRRRRFQ